MPPTRTRPPYVAPERDQLVGWLDVQRGIALWKCEDLSDEDAHRVIVPTSPLMTVAGLISHLRWAEHLWFEVLFLGRPAEGPAFREDVDDGDFRVAGVPLGQLCDEYRAQCRISDEIVAAHGLDDVGRHDGFEAANATLRWMLIHMVEETARHAGHLDLLRELLDGRTGYY